MIAQRRHSPEAVRDGLVWKLPGAALGFTPEKVWNPSPAEDHRTEPYPVPRRLRIGLRVNVLTSSKFSPPPVAVIVEGEGRRCYFGIEADAGRHRWNDAEFYVTPEGMEATVDLEGLTDARHAQAHIRLRVVDFSGDTSLHQALAEGLALQYPGRSTRRIPWWLRPIYCGWGDQVAYAQAEEGVGAERRAMAYCIQGLYERWISRFEAAGLPIGTVTIDGGWSLTGVWQPDPIRWPDLRGFVDRQHAVGRKVLLWIGTWLWDGLPKELSILGDGRQWTADPGNPRYLEQITHWVGKLLGPSGYNADGFKIDQLSFSPNRRRPRWCPRFGFLEEGGDEVQRVCKASDEWGIELLYRYQKRIYNAAKSAKPDALVTSSTVHPYFHDTFDMVRLHDMGREAPDIMAAMRARADLARAALPGFPIDTDDWVHGDYARWLEYTSRSHEIGVPCLFFTERFISHWSREPSTRAVTDLPRIAEAWRKAGYAREQPILPAVPPEAYGSMANYQSE